MLMLRKISKQYGYGITRVDALSDVHLYIERGEFVSIMGKSGAGKSTLMNIICCLDRPTHGNYTIDDNDIYSYNDNDLAIIRNEKIGFIFQSFNLLPRITAFQNVELPLIYARIPRAERKRLAREALVRVGLEDRMHHRPNELSGGQKQRVATARALVNSPSIILADEPTGNLDSATTTEILKLFCELNDEGATILCVTHEQEVAEYSKRIITLHDGTIVNDYSVTGSSRRWD